MLMLGKVETLTISVPTEKGEPMAEYIERETLLEKISRMIDYCEKDKSVNGLTVLFQVGDAIIDCKASNVAQVRHCRWEKWNGDDRHHCTGCECYANAERDSYGYIAYEFLDNYCPNCGARMDLEVSDGKS